MIEKLYFEQIYFAVSSTKLEFYLKENENEN